jgi:hypothetical protein
MDKYCKECKKYNSCSDKDGIRLDLEGCDPKYVPVEFEYCSDKIEEENNAKKTTH